MIAFLSYLPKNAGIELSNLSVFYQSPVTQYKTSLYTTIMPLTPMPAQQTNASGDFFAFYPVDLNNPFF